MNVNVNVVVSFSERTQDLLEGLVDTLGCKSSAKAPLEAQVKTPQATKEEDVKEVVATVEAEEEKVDEFVPTLSDIKLVARKLVDNGYKGNYVPVLERYGYDKVNKILDKDIPAIYNELKALETELIGE